MPKTLNSSENELNPEEVMKDVGRRVGQSVADSMTKEEKRKAVHEWAKDNEGKYGLYIVLVTLAMLSPALFWFGLTAWWLIDGNVTPAWVALFSCTNILSIGWFVYMVGFSKKYIKEKKWRDE